MLLLFNKFTMFDAFSHEQFWLQIPQSAVEMPGSMSSMQLDVQFGNWDSPSNAGLLSSGNQQNESEMIQDKQAMNLQQYMSGLV